MQNISTPKGHRSLHEEKVTLPPTSLRCTYSRRVDCTRAFTSPGSSAFLDWFSSLSDNAVLRQSFESTTSIDMALKLLKKFQSIVHSENLKGELKNKISIIFHRYGWELQQVSPPLCSVHFLLVRLPSPPTWPCTCSRTYTRDLSLFVLL